MQFYDPHTLIREVEELLRSFGLDPQLVDSQLAQTGACMMLRGLNAFPAIDPVDAYMSTLDKEPWPDADDRRAARMASAAWIAADGGTIRPGEVPANEGS
jgi:hypothetical protein